MWNGSRPGPRGGMPFRGEPRGGMFEGRDGPIPDFRGRDGMNMGRSPMDMRRFDCPPDMRGRDMGLHERGREPSREFFRPGDEMDMNFRRRFEMDQRNNLQNSPGFMGQSRPPMDMGNRDMQGGNMRGPEDGFMNMRERERFQMDMPGLPPIDIRRRLAMVAMGGNGDIGDMRDRERSRMGGIDGFNMDMPSRDRPMMDFERRGVTPPLNPRGRFESDMDMRNRMGSSNDFRDQPAPMFRDNDGVPMDIRGRPDMPLGRGGPESMIRSDELTLRDREFPEAIDSPMGFRGRESDSLSDEWRSHGVRDRETLPPMMGRTPPLFQREMPDKFFSSRGKDVDLGDRSQFKDRDRDRQSGFLGKDETGFNRSERDSKLQNWDKNIPSDFPARDTTPKPGLLPIDPALNAPIREGDKPWPSDRDEKPDRTAPAGSRPPYFQDKNPLKQEHHFASDHVPFKGSSDIASDQGPPRESLVSGPKENQGNRGERQDQDYRDIDYRTGSGRKYDYNLGDLQAPERDVKESKLGPAQRPDDSGSQDQDYRSAGVQEKVSKTISISGIPKTATMQQILDAFAVRDGVPMQGMKIKDVVPGYSYDMAYVEFLNLEDAVHFMESNKGSVKVGDKTALLKYIQPDKNVKEQYHEPPTKAAPASDDGLLPNPVLPPNIKQETDAEPVQDPGGSQGVWQRSSNLTPEAWQQQVDQQLQQQEVEHQTEEWTNQRASRQNLQHSDPIFKESKTMIIKNILPTTTVETILQALDPFAYLDERNVRLVKGKSPGSKCFCFVDMDSHEHVTRLVELLTKPRTIMIDGVRVYAEVAKPLKNQNYRRDNDKSNTSLLGFPPDVMMQHQYPPPRQQYYPPPSHTTMGVAPALQGDPMGADVTLSSAAMQSSSFTQGVMYSETTGMVQSVQTAEHQTAALSDALPGAADNIDGYSYGSEAPDLSAFLYDATSGFYYDPLTTLYYDPNSRYFYDAQNQQYLYWDSATKTYVPVQSSSTDVHEPPPEVGVPVATVAEVIATPITEEEVKVVPEAAAEPGAEVRADEEPSPRAEKKEKEKEEKPRSLAAFKIMKDMERWAKIQNRQKETVRAPSPLFKSGDDQRPSKAADAAFAIFERKVSGADELFKKPLAPPKQKDEKSSKRPMGSLGMLAADYGAGSDDEEEEKHEKQEASRPTKSQPQADEKEDRLTDWKKMACLLCRRQFPNKDALLRHQQLSDLHKQNMEIHLKIKRSKRELEALENQEKEMKIKESNGSPEAKRRKPQNTWAGTSRDSHKGSERPGLGLETTERKKKEPVVWNHATYKQAVRKAMFARFNELD
ncbi:RNA-binding protein 6 [Pimephales promelas]|uniref:RNA-binding protein 6 n=1 Tax=Pimephales promelas TaxID=90988 RepID=UPI00195595B3|nr:RNA-binding protein 6 [Pimephales promelas]KAG1942780.1 RNA-binding protein [Pimephales promelas]KAG1942781.1 RNA-binding protein [Pimephales promelas]KAG1942782.1 RNA-binding protein [Pimephales promelas]